MTGPLVLAFGDLGTAPWGAAWIPDAQGTARLAVRRGSASQVLEGALTPEPPGEVWRFEAEGVSLAFTPAAEPVHSHDAEERLRREDALCEVSGQLRIAGQDAEVSCLGWRSRTDSELDLTGFDSLRFLAGWLGRSDGFSLLALRPAKAGGHEADLITAAVLEDPPTKPVADPRLSTTYTEQGFPAKAGLELWLAEDEPEEDGAVSHHPPRRAAGEAAGAGLEWSQGDLDLQATLLRWHSHAQEGPGVYVLGQRR